MASTPSPNDSGPTDGIELGIAVSDRVHIQNILMVESHARRGHDDEFAESMSVAHKIDKVEFTKDEDQGILSVQITAIAASTKQDAKKQPPAVLLVATFVLNYKIDSFDGLTDDNLRVFANTNGVFNAWPYWREFVQNMTVRMGIPPIVAPVFRIAQNASSQEADSTNRTPPSESEGNEPVADQD